MNPRQFFLQSFVDEKLIFIEGILFLASVFKFSNMAIIAYLKHGMETRTMGSTSYSTYICHIIYI